MILWHSYARALQRRPLYLLFVLAAFWFGVKIPRVEIASGSEISGGVTILFLIAAYFLIVLVEPRELLKIHPFLLGLPAARERLALMLWVALALPLLSLLWPIYSFSVSWGLHAVALMEISLLIMGSALGWLFLLLPVVALWATCTPDRWSMFLLFSLPYLVSGGLWLGRHLPSWHWRGFRYPFRYFIPLAAGLVAFDLYQRSINTAMRFRMDNSMFGLYEPDFDHSFLLLFFLLGGIGFIFLPFFNTFSLREADAALVAVRQMTGTPWSRRWGALSLAVLFNVPLALVMPHLGFVNTSFTMIWHLVFSAACFNVLFLSVPEPSDWVGYALVGYLLWVHLVPASVWWDLLLAVSTLLAYDLDIWLPRLFQRVRKTFEEFVWHGS